MRLKGQFNDKGLTSWLHFEEKDFSDKVYIKKNPSYTFSLLHGFKEIF